MDFEERVVIVTGAAGNLGRAVADAFAKRGARLVLVDVARERFAASAESDRSTIVGADLRTREGADAVARAALQRFGGIDVTCNIAGAFRMGDAVHETSDDTWQFL